MPGTPGNSNVKIEMAGELWEHYQGDQLRIAAATVPTFAILAWLLNSHWSVQILLGFLLVRAKSTGLQPMLTLSRSNQDNPELCPAFMTRKLISLACFVHTFCTSTDETRFPHSCSAALIRKLRAQIQGPKCFRDP